MSKDGDREMELGKPSLRALRHFKAMCALQCCCCQGEACVCLGTEDGREGAGVATANRW